MVRQNDTALKARLILSVFLAIAITGCCLFLTWLYGGGNALRHQRYTLSILRDTDRAIAIYRQKNGRLPHSLSDLKTISNQIHLYQDVEGISDVWKNPLTYQVHDNRYTLMSYGWDGKRGGIGLSADISSVSTKRITAPLPFLQVITYPTSQDMAAMSLLSGLVTLIVCFIAIKPNDLDRDYRVDLVSKLGCIFFATLVLAAIVTILQVPPGH